MKCNICGDEKGIFSVFGYEGKLCEKCNIYLHKLNNGHAAEAKIYFDSITKGKEVTEDTSRFLTLEYRKHRKELDESGVSPTPAATHIIIDTPKVKNDVPPIQSGYTQEERSALSDLISNRVSNDNSNHISKILEELDTQNNHLKTIKNILIFFATITCIGLLGTFIYIIQIVNAIKTAF